VSKSQTFKPDAVILTALDVESSAVATHFSMTGRDFELKSGFRINEGNRSCDWGTWTVGLLEVGPGNVNSARATTDVLAKYRPKLIAFCGIGGSRKLDVPIGSVVVPDHVYFYESGKEGDAGFLARPRVMRVSERLTQIAIKLRRSGSWTQLLATSGSKKRPVVIVKPLASGEVLVATPTSSTEDLLQLHYEDAQAVEMEGYGVLSAADTVPAFVVRGISDNRIKGGQREPSHQRMAATNAAAMAVAMADEYLKRRPRGTPHDNVRKLTDQPRHAESSEAGNQEVAPLGGEHPTSDTSLDLAQLRQSGEQAIERGMARASEDRYAEALECFEAAIQPAGRMAISHRRLGDAYRLFYRIIDQLWELARELSREPACTEVAWLRAQTYLLLGRPKVCLEFLKAGAEQSHRPGTPGWSKPQVGASRSRYHRGSPETCWCKAQAYRSLDRNDYERRNAEDELGSVLQIDPENVNALVSRAELKRLGGHPEEALKDLNQAVRYDPHSFAALLNRGETYRILNLPDAALKDLNAALEIVPNDISVLAVRGAVFLALGRPRDALRDLNQVLEWGPERVLPLLIRGEALRALGRHKEALEDFDSAVALRPDAAAMLDGRRGAYAVLDEEEPLNSLERALRLRATNQDDLLNRAFVYERLGRDEDALKDLQSVLDTMDKNAQALHLRANIYQRLKRNTAALTDLDLVMELNPDRADVLMSRGDVYYALGRKDDGLKDIERALSLESGILGRTLPRLSGRNSYDAERFLMRVQLYRELDNSDRRALHDLNGAAELDPNRAETFWARSMLVGTKEGILRDTERALELDPLAFSPGVGPGFDHPIDRLNNVLYFAQADGLHGPHDKKILELGLETANQVLELEPEYPLALGARGRIYMAMGRYAEAVADFEHASELKRTVRWFNTHLEISRRAEADAAYFWFNRNVTPR
jgi:tetratricopeptide (TPR) repeat protein/nucleoside phosphorylase